MKIEISEKDIQEMLMADDLKKIIIKEELSKQIVGEEKSIDTILTCCIGSKVENAQLTSFNLLVNDESTAGKDWVVNHVLKIFPKNMWEHSTRVSPTSLCYYHNAEQEPDWTWDGKIFYLEDPSNTILNSEVLKLMASTGSDALITIKPGKVVKYRINGKPVIITTMATSFPNEEIRNRFNIVNLDSGIDQTKAIMERQTERARTGKAIEYDPLITGCLGYLKRMPVLLPFLNHKKVEKMFPTTLIMRRQYNRFLDYVKAQTILMQLQRKIIQELPNEPEILLGTKEDWNNAIEPFMKTVTNPMFIPLTKNDQRLLETIEKFGENYSTIKQIAERCSFYSEKSLYTKCRWLTEKGFLEQIQQEQESSKKPVFAYQFIKQTKFKIKEW